MCMQDFSERSALDLFDEKLPARGSPGLLAMLHAGAAFLSSLATSNLCMIAASSLGMLVLAHQTLVYSARVAGMLSRNVSLRSFVSCTLVAGCLPAKEPLQCALRFRSMHIQVYRIAILNPRNNTRPPVSSVCPNVLHSNEEGKALLSVWPWSKVLIEPALHLRTFFQRDFAQNHCEK